MKFFIIEEFLKHLNFWRKCVKSFSSYWVEPSMSAVLKKMSVLAVSLGLYSAFLPYFYFSSSNSSFFEGIIVFLSETYAFFSL